jgi:serine/threonine-protein kinase
MNGWVASTVAGLALLSQAWAEPLELVVQTRPPGALLRDQFGNELGRSNKPFTVDWDRSRGPLTLEMLLKDHQKVSRTLSYAEIKNGVYPTDGAISLPADSLVVAAKDSWNEHSPWYVLSLAALALAGWALRGKLRSNPTLDMGPRPLLATVGAYRLVERIGQGATAEVFLAVSESDLGALPVALKLLRDRESLDGQTEARFRAEIKTSLALRHENLAQLYDWGQDADGRLFMVSELLRGQTLRERLATKVAMTGDEVARIVRCTGAALTYLHSQGMVHRDVKPDNVFLTEGHGVKLMDLGIAKGGEIAPMTQTGVVLGTPHYMAPEQLSGESTASSDQYALGVTAYEMLAGRRPFRGATSTELLQQHISEPVPRISEFRPGASLLLEDVLDTMLAKHPAQRFVDVESAVRSLCSALLDGDDVGLDTEAHGGLPA